MGATQRKSWLRPEDSGTWGEGASEETAPGEADPAAGLLSKCFMLPVAPLGFATSKS